MIAYSTFLFFVSVVIAVALAIYAFTMGRLSQQKQNVKIESKQPKKPTKKTDSETSNPECKIGKHLGYLRKLGKKKPIPLKCLSCPLGIEECMKKK